MWRCIRFYITIWPQSVKSACSYRPIRAYSPIVQGYGKASRGSCHDKHTSVSSSRLAVSVCRWGSGRSPQLWWFEKAYSSGSRCTVRSTAACRHERCSSPGERAEWGLVMCSWPCTAPAVPTGKTACAYKHTHTHRQVRREDPSKHCNVYSLDVEVKARLVVKI